MKGKSPEVRFNPFKPGIAHQPPLLAGRDDETGLLTEAMDRLLGPRARIWGRLAKPPHPPIKIVGPRGVGKTTLLGWLERQAKKRGVRCASCAGLKPKQPDFSMGKLLREISGVFQKTLYLTKGLHLSEADRFSAGVELRQETAAFMKVARRAVRRRPLLLLLDEVQHYDLEMLRAVLQGSELLIGEGRPLGVVMAGTPDLDIHLAKADPSFISRCRNVYINMLSDAATREGLRVPFEQDGATVTPEALEAMAAQTDNYPYFIQLVGMEAWKEMTRAGRKEVHVDLVRRIEERVRVGRKEIHSDAYRRLVYKKVLPQARQVMALIEASGGETPEKEVVKALIEANADVDGHRAQEICAELRVDGFIWTVRGKTSTGRPSFFNYCRDNWIE